MEQVDNASAATATCVPTNTERTAGPASPCKTSAPSVLVTTSTSTAATTATPLKPTAVPSVDSLPRARGLSNLGNTCFFNACMQCLGQTPYLTTIFKEAVIQLPGGEFKNEANISVKVPPIDIRYSVQVKEILQAFQDILGQLQTPGAVLNPSRFFNMFTSQHPQFGGGDQHDSHELLRHLLDSVLSSESKIYHSQLIAADKKKLTPDERQKLELYAAQSKDRYLIRRVFQGSLESTLRCEDCGNTSPNKETFLDISLPVNQQHGMTSNSLYSARPKCSPEPTKRQLKKEKKAARRAASKANGGEDDEDEDEENSAKEIADEQPSDLESCDEQNSSDELDNRNNDAKDDEIYDAFATFRLSASGVTQLLRKHSALSNDEHCRTIGARYVTAPGECSVQSCLNAFVAVELLSDNNKVTCEACTKRLNGADPKAKSVLTNATKQFLVSSLPAVLILHLKRFQMGMRHNSFLKLSTEVTFPLVLDMGPFCAASPQTAKEHRTVHRDQKRILYSLYGIVEHSGTMHTGHYIAYIKVRAQIKMGDPRFRFVSTLYNEMTGGKQRMRNGDAVVNGLNNGMTNGSSITNGEHHKEDEEVEDETNVKMNGVGNGPSSSNSSSDSEPTEEDSDNVRPPPGKWYKISDSRVSETTEEHVLRAQAYLLFYERIF